MLSSPQYHHFPLPLLWQKKGSRAIQRCIAQLPLQPAAPGPDFLQISLDPLQLPPNAPIHALEVHMGLVDSLQGVMGGLGLPQGLQALLAQGGLHPADKPQVGFAALEVGGGNHALQTHPAVGWAAIDHPLPACDEGQAQLWQEQMLNALHVVRIRADNGAEAPGTGAAKP